MTTPPHPCADCISEHGDTAAEWLRQWPAGADWDEQHRAHLCDGCAEGRTETAFETMDCGDPSWSDPRGPSELDDWNAFQSEKLDMYRNEF